MPSSPSNRASSETKKTRRETPIWGAARQMPSVAAASVSRISTISRWISAPGISSGATLAAGALRTLYGIFTTVLLAIATLRLLSLLKFPFMRLAHPRRFLRHAAESPEKVLPAVLGVKIKLLEHALGKRPQVRLVIHLGNAEVGRKALRLKP